MDYGALLNTFWSDIFNVYVAGSMGHGRQQERRRRPRTTMFRLTVRRSLERRDVHDQQQQRPARFHGAAASTVGTPASIALRICLDDRNCYAVRTAARWTYNNMFY